MKAWAVVGKKGKITGGLIGDGEGVYPIFVTKDEAEKEVNAGQLAETVKQVTITIIKKGGK